MEHGVERGESSVPVLPADAGSESGINETAVPENTGEAVPVPVEGVE